jgi:hypothetical protein
MSRTSCRPSTALIVLVALAWMGGLSAVAGEGTVEERLAAGGVEPGIQADVLRAIDRGVQFLERHQSKDGSFGEHWNVPDGFLPAGARMAYGSESGVTLLCALALSHVGSPSAKGLAARAIAWLGSTDERAHGIRTETYEAAMAVLLADREEGLERLRAACGSALASGQDALTGLWGYDLPDTTDDRYARPTGKFVPAGVNLSTSQFAALGLSVAFRPGPESHLDVWRRHGTALCASQAPSGGWPYSPDATRPPGDGGAYLDVFSATFIGVSDLALARAAVAVRPGTPGEEVKRLDLAIERGDHALQRDAIVMLEDPMRGSGLFAKGVLVRARTAESPRTAQPGIGAYYGLFALQLACVLRDVRVISADPIGQDGHAEGVGSRPRAPGRDSAPHRGREDGAPRNAGPAGKGVEWYPVGARWIVDRQRGDGGWSPNPAGANGDSPSEIDTAFALLFLARAADAYRPPPLPPPTSGRASR